MPAQGMMTRVSLCDVMSEEDDDTIFGDDMETSIVKFCRNLNPVL